MAKHDVVIAGGGVVGAMIGYFLSRDRDRSVCLIDIKKPGNASRASAGGLWPIGESVGLGCGVIFFKTMSKQIQEGADLGSVARPHQLPRFFFDFCLASNAMFPELWERIRGEHNVDFEFERTGLKFVMYDEHDRAYAQKIADSIPHLADQLRWLDREELRAEEPNVSDEAIGALMFLRDDQVNPYLLVRAAREAGRAHGMTVMSETEVTGVRHRNDGSVCGVDTTAGPVDCDLLINAAGSWASELAEKAVGRPIPVSPVKGQIVLSERMPRMLRSCLSTSDCYIAQKKNGEILIGSTTEERGFDATCSIDELRGLTRGAVRCLPGLSQASIKRTWAGLRPGTPDEVPILGPVDGIGGYLNACGHFRTGILTAPITASLIRSLVRGERPELDLEPFLLRRFDGVREDAAPSWAAQPSAT